MIGINQLVAVVTLIVLMRSGNVAGTATGFFYANKDSLYLITNKHVITKYAPDALKLRLHKSPNNIMDNGEFLVKLYDKKKKVWLEHKKKEVDVVAVPLDKIKLQKDFFYQSIVKR